MSDTLIKADGLIAIVKPKEKTYSLKTLQEAVGGYVELIDLDNGYTMVVNESGRLQHLPVNVMATEVYRTSKGSMSVPIVGDVLHCASVHLG